MTVSAAAPARPAAPVATAAAPASPTVPDGSTPWTMPPTMGQFTFEVPSSAQRRAVGSAADNDIPDEGGLMEAWHTVDGSLPDKVRDPMYRWINTRVNDVIFRSRPGGAPQPEQPGSWHFSAFGDFGNGTKAMVDIADNIIARKPEMIVSAGDQVYPNSEAVNWETKVDPPGKLGRLMSTVPFLPNMGNHDMDPNASEYFRRFPYIENGRYYKASYKNTDVFSIDSNQALTPGSPQLAWLDDALAGSKAPWKIVSVHHPMMSVLSKFHYRETSKLPTNLGPLLAKYGVDLLVAGHEHWYERSRPLNEQGTVQVTVGGGGGALYPFFYPQQRWSATRDLDFGHVDFEVRGDDELVGRYVTRDGKVQDTFSIPNRTPRGWKEGDALVGGAADVSPERPPLVPAGSPAAPITSPA